MGWDDAEQVTATEVVAREAALLRPENQRNASSAGQFGGDAAAEIGQRHHRLLGLAGSERPGADHQRAIFDGIREALRAFGVLEEGFGPNGRLGLAPVRLIGRDDREMREAEVGHGSRRRADVERVARRDEHDLDAVELAGGEQGAILVRDPVSGVRPDSGCDSPAAGTIDLRSRPC